MIYNTLSWFKNKWISFSIWGELTRRQTVNETSHGWSIINLNIITHSCYQGYEKYFFLLQSRHCVSYLMKFFMYMDVDMIPTVFLGANRNQRTVTSSDVFVPVICNVYPFPCSVYFLLMFAFVVLDESFLNSFNSK